MAFTGLTVVYGSLLASMDVYEGLRRFAVFCRGFWAFMRIFEWLWPFIGVYGGLIGAPGCFMCVHGYLWVFVGLYGC